MIVERGSVHSVNFSAIQASCPTGESVSAYDTVCGRVECSTMYPGRWAM